MASEIMSNKRRNFLKHISVGTIGVAVGALLPWRYARSLNASPAVFYSPHQDDEAIGMAGAIAEHKAAGRPVYLVLLTNGINSGLLDLVNAKLASQGLPAITLEQMMWGRRSEFIAAGQALGVDKIYLWEDGQGLDDARAYNADTYPGFVRDIAAVIEYFEAKFPGASHKLAANDACVSCSPVAPNMTHQACWEAGKSLQSAGKISDFRFYRVYEYLKPLQNRGGQYVAPLNATWMEKKRAALNEYKLWNPKAGRYGLGYLSVKSLIDAAYNDPREFLDL